MADPGSESEWWEAPWEFFIHSIVGILIFGIIAGAAIALDFAVRFLSDHRVNQLIVGGLKIAEFGLFTMDLFLFIVFIFRSAKRAFRRL